MGREMRARSMPMLGFGIALLLTSCGATPTDLSRDDELSVDGPTTDASGTCLEGTAELPEEIELTAQPAGQLTYIAVEGDVRDPVTKFGGQPVWIDDPQWPLGASSGAPMTFIGQIELGDPWFPERDGLAYVFMSEFVTGEEATWDAYSGENAVIVQPDGNPLVPVARLERGPSVQTWMAGGFEDVAYRVELEPVEDPAYLRIDDRARLDPEASADYSRAVYPDKIGGTPDFFQGGQFPECGAMTRLAFQIGLMPFSLNLGDGGLGFAFVDLERGNGRFLWQSH